jgi:hypothetical protein
MAWTCIGPRCSSTRVYYLHVQPDDIEERQLAMEWVRAKSLDEHARMGNA